MRNGRAGHGLDRHGCSTTALRAAGAWPFAHGSRYRSPRSFPIREDLALRTLLTAACLAAGALPALAGPTCSPSESHAQILGSATIGDVHPAWHGRKVGYGWSLQVRREDHDDAGMTYYVGDLYDAQGKLAMRNIFALDSEWECGP